MKICISSLMLIMLIIMGFCPVLAWAGSLDTLVVVDSGVLPNGLSQLFVYLRNGSFAVGGFSVKLVISDPNLVWFVKAERGKDVADFAYFSSKLSDGDCRIVGIASMVDSAGTALKPGYHEIARIKVEISSYAPPDGFAWIKFEGDANSISDETGYNLVAPTLMDGKIWFSPSDIDDNSEITPPEKPDCLSNYPNPFNAQTTISFSLTSKIINASLSIFDILGRRVKSFFLGDLETGKHALVWDGTNEDGDEAGSGIYLYLLQGENFMASAKRMTLIR